MNYKNPLLCVIGHAVPSSGRVIFASACSVLNKLCDIVPELLIGMAIDVVVNQDHSFISKLGISNPFFQLYFVGSLTALLWIFESIFEYFYLIAWRKIAHDIQHGLRLKTFSKVQTLDMAYFENTSSGALLSVIQEDINQLEQFLGQGANEIIQLTVNVIVMGLLFFSLSPMLALLTILPIPFVIGISYYFQRKLAFLYEVVRIAAARLTGHIAYRLQGIVTIKSYLTESYEVERLRTESNAYTQASAEAHAVTSLYIPIVRMAIMVGFISSLIMGGVYALQGTMPIHWYAALVFLTQRFLWPFTSITTITDMYERSLASAKRLVEILEAAHTIQSGANHLSSPAVRGAITFKNVSFSYSNGVPVFKNITFEIPAKKTVAFVGATGSGKSTIMKLLLRFYDATAGIILLDGQDIKTLQLDDLRHSVAFVSQDVYMVEGTIADNIAYGTFDASRESIIQAAQIAQAHDFIKDLPQGYDTHVSEYGKNLSGGQRQRLSIARALIRKSPIIIFDEATSALDNETEAAFKQSMQSLRKDHTLILIAHRLSTVRSVDTIFVVENGVIAEQGNHQDLLEENGQYARLWNA